MKKVSSSNGLENCPSLRFNGFISQWIQLPFSSLFTHIGGTALEKYVGEKGTHKFISIGNYSKYGTYLDNGQRIELNEITKQKLLNKNDLVMVLNDKTIKGDIIGSTLLIDCDNSYIYNQRSERIIPNSKIDPSFAWNMFNSPIIRDDIRKRCKEVRKYISIFMKLRI